MPEGGRTKGIFFLLLFSYLMEVFYQFIVVPDRVL